MHAAELKPMEIAKAHHPLACAYYSLINLYRVRRILPEPTFAQLAARFLSDVQRETGGSSRTVFSVTALDQLRLLTECEFPAFCAVGAIPAYATARDIFLPFLSAGCHLIVNFTLQWQGQMLAGHSVVAEGFNDEGLEVLDSTGGYPEGSRVELETNYTQAELAEFRQRREQFPFGTRRLLPYYHTQTVSDPVGVHSYFLIAYPDGRNGN